MVIVVRASRGCRLVVVRDEQGEQGLPGHFLKLDFICIQVLVLMMGAEERIFSSAILSAAQADGE